MHLLSVQWVGRDGRALDDLTLIMLSVCCWVLVVMQVLWDGGGGYLLSWLG